MAIPNPEELVANPDFMNSTLEEKDKHLSAVDPGYRELEPTDRLDYLEHILTTAKGSSRREPELIAQARPSDDQEDPYMNMVIKSNRTPAPAPADARTKNIQPGSVIHPATQEEILQSRRETRQKQLSEMFKTDDEKLRAIDEATEVVSTAEASDVTGKGPGGITVDVLPIDKPAHPTEQVTHRIILPKGKPLIRVADQASPVAPDVMGIVPKNSGKDRLRKISAVLASEPNDLAPTDAGFTFRAEGKDIDKDNLIAQVSDPTARNTSGGANGPLIAQRSDEEPAVREVQRRDEEPLRRDVQRTTQPSTEKPTPTKTLGTVAPEQQPTKSAPSPKLSDLTAPVVKAAAKKTPLGSALNAAHQAPKDTPEDRVAAVNRAVEALFTQPDPRIVPQQPLPPKKKLSVEMKALLDKAGVSPKVQSLLESMGASDEEITELIHSRA